MLITITLTVMIVSLLLWGWLSTRLGHRVLVGSLFLPPSIAGIMLVIQLPASNAVGRLAGYCMTQTTPSAFLAMLAQISTNIAGTTKKTTAAAMFLIGYSVGNLIGPQTFRASEAPGYRSAEITILVCYSVCILIQWLLWLYLRRQNQKKAETRARPGYAPVANQEFMDLTDKENLEFTYTL